MNYKTHTAGSLLSGLFIMNNYLHVPLTPSLFFLSGTILGGILPDLDHRNSYLGNRVKPISICINLAFGHRKLFHAPILYLILYFLSNIFCKDMTSKLLVLGILVGVFSHLILDTISGGIPWLYPYSKRIKTPFIRIKTNSLFEKIIFIILSILNLTYIPNVFANFLK